MKEEFNHFQRINVVFLFHQRIIIGTLYTCGIIKVLEQVGNSIPNRAFCQNAFFKGKIWYQTELFVLYQMQY
jgi:hypothetical protein